MRVAVFRADGDGRRTARRLADRGHEAVLAPVLRIVPTGATVHPGSTGVLVFTSAHAPEALAQHPHGIAHLVARPCWCVGERTAAAAREAGFATIVTGAGDGIRLAAALIARHECEPVTLVAGRDRKPDLETALRRHGIGVDVVEAYAAKAVAAWPADVMASLKGVEAALHYSRRSAALAFDLGMASASEGDLRNWSHHCLSADVAEALRKRGVTRISVAARPDEESLLEDLRDGIG